MQNIPKRLEITSYLSPETLSTLSDNHLWILNLRLQGKTNKEIGEITGYSKNSINAYFNDSTCNVYLKPVLEEALHNRDGGLLDPVEISKGFETSVLRVFLAKVLSDETSDEMKLKYGESILKYRQNLLKITEPPMSKIPSSENSLPVNKLARLVNAS